MGHDWGEWKNTGNAQQHTRTCQRDQSHTETAAHTPGTPANCTTPQTCTACGYEITPANNNHDWNAWESNGNGTHTHTCKNDSSHTETTNCSGGSATCEARAVCDVCHMVYGELAPHTLTHTPAVDATCTTPGNVEYWHCSVCGKNFSDSAGKGELTEITSPALNHNWGAWEKGSETQHQRICQNDGSHKETGDHTLGTAATCKAPANCSICGQSYGEKNPSNHTGGTEVRNQKEATTTTEGYTGDTYCKDCGEPYVTEESIKKIQEVVRIEGTNAWWAKEAKDLVPEGAKCPKCGCTEFKKETDIMDVWFDSGSTHQSVLVERGLDYPADLYLEGNDQYRGWFQSSLLTSVAVNGIAPYKEVLCCGFVVDGQGRKMSKSLGNGVSPIDVSNKFGADILRLWALSSDYSMDVNLSDDILKGISDVYRKIRNTARYILGNTYDYDPEKPVAYEDLQEIDKWALTRLNKLIKDCTNDYDTYSFGNCYHDVNQFCVVDMSSFYLDIIKDRLYTEKADSVARRAAQTTMYYILDALVKILTPMISFTAEEIWSAMNHTEKENVESPMLADYPVPNDEWDNKEIAEKWEKIIKVKNIVAKDLELARAEKTIGNSLDAKVTIYAEGEEYKFLKENEELIKLVLIVSGLEIQENNRKQEEKLGVKVEHATGEKCERCWMYNDHLEDGLCPRCKEVLEK